MRETILRNVNLGVANLPGGERALAFVEANGDLTLVPMSDENFERLASDWRGLVVAATVPAMAIPRGRGNGG